MCEKEKAFAQEKKLETETSTNAFCRSITTDNKECSITSKYYKFQYK